MDINPINIPVDEREPAAFYGRYSDDKSKQTSIEDQLRNCVETADEKGCQILDEFQYKDEAKTGTTLFHRKGFAALRAAYKKSNPLFCVIFIDDTSRLGRKEADVHTVLDELEYYGIRLCFASDGLDSADPGFRDIMTSKARHDAVFSKAHGKRVRRGLVGQFERGYNPGWTCFGYRNKKVIEENNHAGGRADFKGMKEEVDPEEAKVVVQIFKWCAMGLSLRKIMIRLNEQRIPPPRKKGWKIDKCSWTRSAVDYIIHNNKYIGICTLGKTSQVRNPENGRMTLRRHPESEWRCCEHPELRIVSQDLWDKAHAELDRKNKIGKERSGGLNRTNKSQTYFLSSLLECGKCGAKYNIDSHGNYACANHLWRNGCENCARFKRTDIEQALLSALCDKIRSETYREKLVQAVFNSLKTAQAEYEATAVGVVWKKGELEAELMSEERGRAHLLEAIRIGGDIHSLVDALASVENKIERIKKTLLNISKPFEINDIRLADVRKFVEEQANCFENLLMQSAETLKIEFQRRIAPALKVTPAEIEEGRVFLVEGDVSLFSMSADGAVLSDQVIHTKQQSLIGVRFYIPLHAKRLII